MKFQGLCEIIAVVSVSVHIAAVICPGIHYSMYPLSKSVWIQFEGDLVVPSRKLNDHMEDSTVTPVLLYTISK